MNQGLWGRSARVARGVLGVVAVLCSAMAFGQVEGVLDPEAPLDSSFVPEAAFEGVWKRVKDNKSYALKVIADGRWAEKRFDPVDGALSMYYGGSYICSGDIYLEKVEFLKTDFGPRLGRSNSYRVKVEDDRLYFEGMGDTSSNEEWVPIDADVETDVEQVQEEVDSDEFEGQQSQILDSVAIIKTQTIDGKSNGSGFFVEMDGKKYLVTNQHVLNCSEAIEVRTLSNERIKPVSFEVCKELDLVRMLVTNDVPVLTLQDGSPAIGDKIMVYGNSGGGGVSTQIKGAVLGVGPNLLEVDAEFIQGNSGCPVVNAANEVVGVASYAELYEDTENWLSKDTRFQKVRRYAIRADSAQWMDVSPGAFIQQTKFLSDMEQAVVMYAITYISFRQYCTEPYKYRHVTESIIDDQGNRSTRSKRVIREQYESEYAHWKGIVDRMIQVGPVEETFYDKKLYRQCAEHYGPASKKFFDTKTMTEKVDGARTVMYRGHRGQLLINAESIKYLGSLRHTLSTRRYVSNYVRSKASALIDICDFMIDFHEGDS